MSKLNIIWTTDNIDTSRNMVFMYARNSKLNHWWDDVTIVIWGASARLVATNQQIQDDLRLLSQVGIEIWACKGCSDNLGVSKELEELNIKVEYLGIALTETLKAGSDEKVIFV